MAQKKVLTQLDLQTITSLLEVDSVNFIGLASKIDGLYMKKRGQNELRLLTTADTLTGGHDAITIANIGNTPNAKGLTLVGQEINLQPANITYGGIITTGTQSFGGEKTFVNNLTISKSQPTLILNAGTDDISKISFIDDNSDHSYISNNASDGEFVIKSIFPTVFKNNALQTLLQISDYSGVISTVKMTVPSLKIGNSCTIGNVWTATDIYGNGSWQVSQGGGNIVSSVFGRTGKVVAVNGDYNTSQVTENTNLYFTDSRARVAISLTINGQSGASTYNNSTGILNVPNYSLTGLGGVPKTRTITINGEVQDLSANRTWNVGDLLSTGSYSNPSWLTSLAWSKITNKPTTFYGYGITETPWTNYLPLTGGVLTGDLEGRRITCYSRNNDYDLSGLQICGNGVTNTIFPTLGFHQPGVFAASIQLRGAIDFGLYAQGGTTLANLTANKLITTSFQLGTSTTSGYVLTADANGNATWQAPQGGTGSTHDPVTLGTANGLSINNQVLSLALGTGSNQPAAGDHLHSEIYVPYENAIHDVNLGSYSYYGYNFILQSDKRLKININSLNSKELDINYVQFNYKTDLQEIRYGVIAQELLKIAPEFVKGSEETEYSVKYIDLLVHEVSYLKNELKSIKQIISCQ